MWTCPKCGRTFKRQEQSHYCGKAPETVEEYIAEQPEEWTIQLPYNRPVPTKLVFDLARWCYETGNHP